jgi:small basic protein
MGIGLIIGFIWHSILPVTTSNYNSIAELSNVPPSPSLCSRCSNLAENTVFNISSIFA